MANRKISVIATSKMVSAISLGVFWRLALSTIAIMRSRNVSPGLVVMRTTSQSDSTRVPPVTALKSPPDSRITGALSPVMALSSTEATPSITSPSPGMKSPASTSTTSSLRKLEPGTRTYCSPYFGLVSFLAWMSRLALRMEAACARLRPSATASAKLANSTVNHSHSVIARMKPVGASPCPPSAWKNSAVVSTLPTHTTNITGFFICWRGLSFLNESTTACLTMSRSNRENGTVLVVMQIS